MKLGGLWVAQSAILLEKNSAEKMVMRKAETLDVKASSWGLQLVGYLVGKKGGNWAEDLVDSLVDYLVPNWVALKVW